LRRPWFKGVVNLMLGAILASSAFLNQIEYRTESHAEPRIYLDVVNGTAPAPAQYRIGVIDAAEYLAVHSHLHLAIVLGILDLLALFLAGFTLLHLLRQASLYRRARFPIQVLGEVSFLVLTQFYLAWLLWYHRPETLTTAASLACALFFLSRSKSSGQTAGRAVAAALGLLLISVAQSLVRADVSLTLNLGILLVCLFAYEDHFSIPKWPLAFTAGAGALLTVAIQYVLMHRIFPKASYGDTPVFQLRHNLTEPVSELPFLLFAIPFLWTVWRVFRRGDFAAGPSKALLVASMFFLAMWLVVGRIEEVRIFLPYTFALVPLTAMLAMRKMQSGLERAQ
jgi:hypothetical protein